MKSYHGAGGAVWLPERKLFLSDADASRAVLSNGAGLYAEHSDFFNTRRGTFGPRALQVELGRSALVLLRTHLRDRAGVLADAVRPPASHRRRIGSSRRCSVSGARRC